MLYLNPKCIGFASFDINFRHQQSINPPANTFLRGGLPGDGPVALPASGWTQVCDEQLLVSDLVLAPDLFLFRGLKILREMTNHDMTNHDMTNHDMTDQYML